MQLSVLAELRLLASADLDSKCPSKKFASH
jgi:hypothetical protein